MAACQTGLTTPAVAQKYSVKAYWVYRLKQLQKAARVAGLIEEVTGMKK